MALQREYQKSVSSTVLPSTPTKLVKPDVPTSSQTYLPPCRKRKHFNASAMSLSKSSVNITSKTSKITNESYTLSTETHESILSKSDLINNVISQNVEVSSQVPPVKTVKAAYTGSPAYVPLIRNGRNSSRNATTYTSGRVFQYVADKVKSKSSLSIKQSNHTSRQVTSTQVKYQENTFETPSPSIPSTSLSTSTTTPNALGSSRSYYAQSETRKEQQQTVTNAQSVSESRSSVSSTDYRSNSSIWSIQTQRNDGSQQTDTFTQQTKMISSSQTPAASVAKNNSISVHSKQNRIDNSEFSSRNEKTVVDMATHDGEDEYSEEIEYELESSEENSPTGPGGRSSTATRSAGKFCMILAAELFSFPNSTRFCCAQVFSSAIRNIVCSDKINPPGFGPPKGALAVQSSTVPTTTPPPDTPSNPITYSESSTSYPVTTSVSATVPASASTPSPTSVRTSTSPQPPPEGTVQPLEPQGPLPSGASSLPATTVPPSEVHRPSALSVQPRTAVAASFQNNSGLPLPPAPQPETPAPVQIPASQVPLQPLNPTEGLTEQSLMLSGGSALQTNQITYQSTSDGSSNSNSLSPSPSVPEYGVS
ncbi:unnamed protein product [Anisakis simplex]|uniref:Uncharacterized protein n=1 Tax=Anisakis simplex TaxID=6269 RepID=A0A3P6S532_ANISI|nr:unnamed protein product [Anisakis simplex]